MNTHVVITCAVTGAGDTAGKSPYVPITSKDIAQSALEAADAGAAIVHIHVRDPQTGKGTRDTDLYRDVVERIRASRTDVVLNLTSGMGGDLVLGPDDDPMHWGEDTDLVGAKLRLPHIEELRPEICTLDCGSLNFGEGSYVYISTPDMLRIGARRTQEIGVKPELEIFDTGNLWFAKRLISEGFVDDPPLFQLCHGIPYGAPHDVGLMQASVNMLPENANWTAFGLGRYQIPFAAQSVLLGGHIRVGLEDNLYLNKGVFATNAQLVERAVTLVDTLGGTVATPAEAREKFGLIKQEPTV